MGLTVQIDDAVAKLLEAEAHRSGESVSEKVNHLLLATLEEERPKPKPTTPFQVKPFALGTPEQWMKWEGLSAEEILDELEGPNRR